MALIGLLMLVATVALSPSAHAAEPAVTVNLTQAEVNWLVRNEYAQSAQDILWRRTKLGLHMNDEQVRALDDFIAAMPAAVAAAE